MSDSSHSLRKHFEARVQHDTEKASIYFNYFAFNPLPWNLLTSIELPSKQAIDIKAIFLKRLKFRDTSISQSLTEFFLSVDIILMFN